MFPLLLFSRCVRVLVQTPPRKNSLCVVVRTQLAKALPGGVDDFCLLVHGHQFHVFYGRMVYFCVQYAVFGVLSVFIDNWKVYSIGGDTFVLHGIGQLLVERGTPVHGRTRRRI